MANEEQLSILKQGVDVWNTWREENPNIAIDLSYADLAELELHDSLLRGINLNSAELTEVDFQGSNLREANFDNANLTNANLCLTDLHLAKLYNANLSGATLEMSSLVSSSLEKANLEKADLSLADLSDANLRGVNLSDATLSQTNFENVDLSETIGIEKANHMTGSSISVRTFQVSKGKIPTLFLKGCGLSDWEIESVRLYNPELDNDEVNEILYKIQVLRTSHPVQISSLFISYNHGNSAFVDKLENYLNKRGIRFWRDIHDMKSGRMEKQIDKALRLNPTVLLILSEHSLQSDWVEHEVRTARTLEKEMKKDILCPIALDGSWKNSPWAKRIMEQIMEYNILDFSEWNDDTKFESTFNKLIDGLELFYK